MSTDRGRPMLKTGTIPQYSGSTGVNKDPHKEVGAGLSTVDENIKLQMKESITPGNP